MVSKAVCTSAQGAIDYFKNHLNAADYFVTGEKMDRGEFIGKVAERLNLSKKAITRDEFVAFVNCDMKALGADSSRPRVSEIKYIEFRFYRKNSGIGKKQVVKEKDGNREDCPRDVALGRAMGSSELRI